jgi:quinoprotein glucose dehydrogenase
MKTSLACFLAGLLGAFPAAAADGDWPNYGRTPGGDRHSPLAQINRDNVAKLTLAWEYKTGEAAIETGNPTALETTPLVVDGVMYISTPLEKSRRWIHSAARRSGRTSQINHKRYFGDWVTRGVSYWRDENRPARVRAASSWPPRRAPGRAGCGHRQVVQRLRQGRGGRLVATLRNKQSYGDEYDQTSPPAIINDLIVVGSAVADNNSTTGASGEVRGFDARSGALRWTWSPVPQDPKDPAYDGWKGSAGNRTGGANTWSIIAADPKRDLVFLPTTSPAVDYYGVTRLGDNRYANSVGGAARFHRPDGLALPDCPPRSLGLRQRRTASAGHATQRQGRGSAGNEDGAAVRAGSRNRGAAVPGGGKAIPEERRAGRSDVTHPANVVAVLRLFAR